MEVNIECVDSFKYLGHIHFQMNDTGDILHQLRQLYGRVIRLLANLKSAMQT